MASPALTLAARTNGRHSQGPKTPEGKRKSAANSRKHGLNSKTPPYDAECTSDHLHFRTVFNAEYHPANPYEASLVETIALAQARMRWVWRAMAAYFNARLKASPNPSANPHSRMFHALDNDPSREYNLLEILENRLFRQSRAARRALEDASEAVPEKRKTVKRTESRKRSQATCRQSPESKMQERTDSHRPGPTSGRYPESDPMPNAASPHLLFRTCAALALAFLPLLLRAQPAPTPYDLVILNGHVIDPASGLDASRNIGIRAGRIAAITTNPIHGKETIDAKGLIVAPGFIDIHDHGQDDENYRYKARDGVTTALEMEVGAYPVDPWYKAREGKALINFGGTSGHIPARMATMHDTGTFLPRDNAVNRAATPAEVDQTLNEVRQGLDQRALGIGMGIAYMPKTSREEIFDIVRLAADRHTPVYVHMRNPGPVEPGVMDSLQEVIGNATTTGASLHIVHITSMAFRQTPLALEMIDGARRRGLDVTTECYPYTAGMTQLESAVFDPGWQERLAIGYSDLQWVATGERMTETTFAKYRKQGGPVVIHSIPEDMVKLALTHPGVIVASDGWLVDGKGHPRAAGTYSRVLARYVREQKVLSLTEAIRKMTILPAVRVNLPNKGRLRVGADADITIFDSAKVEDKATYENPAQYAEGIPWVIVNGVPVVRAGKLQTGIYPGKGIRR